MARAPKMTPEKAASAVAAPRPVLPIEFDDAEVSEADIIRFEEFLKPEMDRQRFKIVEGPAW